LLRIASGERLEKATPADYRYWFGLLALTPVWIAAFALAPFSVKILEHGTSLTLWLYLMFVALSLWAALTVWARLVPARVSGALAVCAWAVALWMSWELL